MPRLATQPNSNLLFLQKAVSVVRFHCQLLAAFELGSCPWWGMPPRTTSNAHPWVEHIDAFPACNGLGIVLPGLLGSGMVGLIMVTSCVQVVGPSSVLSAPVPKPNGGLLERMLMASKRSRAKNWPTPARRANRPVPNTSQAIPTR